MKLYGYWRSSSAWRVRIALHCKAIPFDYQVVRLSPMANEQYDANFMAINPFSQVPVLELDADAGTHAGRPRRLAQSMAILEYLEERFPTPSLLPTDPWLRGRARQLAEMVNAGIQPFQNLPVLNYVKDMLEADSMSWVRHFIIRGLDALEKTALETVGTFLVGDAVSFADVYLVPQLYSARRFSVDLAPYPTLLRVEAACARLPAFIAAHADNQADKPPAG